MSGHTPGPWFSVTFGAEVCGEGQHQVLVSCSMPDPISVATMDRALTATLAEQQANASLIAASPTMAAYIAKRAAAGDSEASAIMEAIHASGQ